MILKQDLTCIAANTTFTDIIEHESTYPLLQGIRKILCDIQFRGFPVETDFHDLLSLTKRVKTAMDSFDASSIRCLTFLILQILFYFLRASTEQLLEFLEIGIDQFLTLSPEIVLLSALVEPVISDFFAIHNLKKMLNYFHWGKREIEEIRDFLSHCVYSFLISICA